MYNNIPDNLRFFRNLRGVDQKTLSEQTGISRTSISRIESGKTLPRSDTLAKLSNALNIKPAQLTEERVNTTKTDIENLMLRNTVTVNGRPLNDYEKAKAVQVLEQVFPPNELTIPNIYGGTVPFHSIEDKEEK